MVHGRRPWATTERRDFFKQFCKSTLTENTQQMKLESKSDYSPAPPTQKGAALLSGLGADRSQKA